MVELSWTVGWWKCEEGMDGSNLKHDYDHQMIKRLKSRTSYCTFCSGSLRAGNALTGTCFSSLFQVPRCQRSRTSKESGS